MMAAGIAATTSSCESQKKEITAQAGQTDADGNVTFNVKGRIFEINVQDSATANPVPNMAVLLFAKDDHANYMVLDPSNNYQPVMGGMAQDASASTPSQSSNVVSTNVLVNNQPSTCGYSAGKDVYQDIWNDTLGKSLFYKEKSGVKLSDIGTSMNQILEAAAGAGAGAAAEKGTVMILSGIGVAKTTVNAVAHGLDTIGLVETGLTACSMIRNDAYADYYRSICYDDSDTFIIYGLKGLNQLADALNNKDITKLLAGFDSPVFVIVPDDAAKAKPKPYAVANLQTFVPSGPGSSLKMKSALASYEVYKADGSLQPVVINQDVGPNAGPYQVVVSACSNFNPEYLIAAPASDALPLIGNITPYTQAYAARIAVKDVEDYSIDFYLEDQSGFSGSCPDGYKTYCKAGPQTTNARGGAHYDMAVACEQPGGYVQGSCKNASPPEAKDGGANRDAPSEAQQAIDGGVGQDSASSGLDGGQTVNASCNKVMDLATNQTLGRIYMNDDYLLPVLSSDAATLNYVDLKTGEVVPITSGHLGKDSLRAVSRGMWNDKFIISGYSAATGARTPYLFDMAAKNWSALPVATFHAGFINDSFILDEQPVPQGTYNIQISAYDLNGALVRTISDSGIYDVSYDGSKLAHTRIALKAGDKTATGVYDLNSDNWQAIPAGSESPVISGDNIAFRNYDVGSQLGVCNLKSGVTTTFDTASLLQYDFVLSEFDFSGNSLAVELIHSSTVMTGAQIYVANIGSGVFQKVSEITDGNVLNIGAYNRKIAYSYFNSTAPNGSIIVCDF